jgi:hypothetical protein
MIERLDANFYLGVRASSYTAAELRVLATRQLILPHSIC